MSRSRGAAALGLLLLLTACQEQGQEPAATATRAPLQVRHDTGELARTFPALGAPVSASWIQWDNAAVDATTTSTTRVTWIDAVVKVTRPVMAELVTQHYSEITPLRPAVQKPLEADVPAGPFRTGVELNLLFAADGLNARVFLDPPQDTVVLQSSRVS